MQRSADGIGVQAAALDLMVFRSEGKIHSSLQCVADSELQYFINRHIVQRSKARSAEVQVS
jgi:hypothetical protein